ncbi:MAG: acylphosphatase [Thaumarchaeota archaeon]|nr:acylphosphatase [Nitrososphaerota archaeon]
MNRRADMTVSGVVQGVGFRYMARIAARQCRLRGEVENLEDDTARITCEGEEEDIDRLVEAVRNAEKPIEVDDVRVEYSEPTGEFRGFRIILWDLVTEWAEGFGTWTAYLRMMLDK